MNDCDYYYFKPTGKWKYHGEGKLPETVNNLTREDVINTNGSMPGISTLGEDYLIVVIPKDSCQSQYAYPRLIQPV